MQACDAFVLSSLSWNEVYLTEHVSVFTDTVGATKRVWKRLEYEEVILSKTRTCLSFL